jgi:hypothetical protein
MSQINIPNIDQVVNEYKILESKLKSKCPDEIEAAEKLADKVIDPSNTSIEKVWRSIWEKPLYSFVTTSTGEKWISSLEPYMKNSLNTWGYEEELLIRKIGKTGKNIDFQIIGKLSSKIKDLNIAYSRLYTIQCAVISLREMMNNNPCPLAFLMDKPMDQNYPFKKYMKQISFGYGWGAITKLHTMADLGCAVKPDLHVCRTIHHLGMCPEIPKGVKVPNKKQCISINFACIELLNELQKRFPSEGHRLRSLDYVLMRISKREILPK